jgi:glycosyltransferase involved in cell wall biosynthesis
MPESGSPAETEPKEPKVIVVMPARQAAATLRETVAEIPLDRVAEIILVDDSSTDETVELARQLPLEVLWHPHQVGYGGNQKTCYMQALHQGADVVVMLHPDGQYEPGLIPMMVEPITEGRADLVLGSRLAIPGAALAAGMPRWKFAAYSRELLLTVPFLRNSLDFSFDSELLYQAAHFGFEIEEVPARCRYFEEASSVGFWTGAVYGLKTLWAGVRLILHRTRILPSRKYKP